ncbi:MAG: sulfite exporter TauE/SafE family protein [Candidatus Omnitrophica bacterium]|nr:sulfite exporter TauE/SafE family protein [Candidatus Omnitrophota bacterium]MCM8830994.1 sulfite exporter TauE/SafE family protein [Candidatus Omnitrophota bacterium]
MFVEVLYNLEKIFISSKVLGLGISFIAGFLASLSPCVYPLVPITLSIIGSVTANSKFKSFNISLVYVLGMATIYTILGIFSAIFGIVFNSLFNNTIVYFFLFLVFLILGLSNLEVIPINIFFSFSGSRNFKRSFVSIFILGMISAFAFIPCNVPVLGAILTLISLRKNIIYSGIALFIFSLGYGIIFIILGTFTSFLKKLPKYGFWSIIVKKFIGIILICIAIYFLLKLIFYR